MDLSIIVPCRNVEATLAAQLDALVGQDWEDEWEVIVVDNNSTDRTAAIVAEYAVKYPRLRLVTARDRAGVSYARNAGVHASTATCVAFCDGDDIVQPGWVAAIGSALRDADLVTGPLDVFSLNPREITLARGTASVGGVPRFGSTDFARGNNHGMRRSTFDRLGGFDEAFVGLEDIEFSLRAAAAGISVTLVPAAYVQYRYQRGTHALWRQGVFYGASGPELSVRARQLGLEPPPRLRGARSWAWLVVHLGDLRTRAGRAGLLWVLANRVGAIKGSLRVRSVYV